MVARLRHKIQEYWPHTLLLLGLLILYVTEITHGLPNREEDWAHDSFPLMPLIAAKKIFLDGWNTGWHSSYPNFHYYMLLGFMTPYMLIQGVLGNLSGLQMDAGYPYGLRDFDTIFTHLAVITRAVSALMALGTAYWTYRIGKALFSPRAGLFAAAIIGCAPAIVYYVHTETLDVPMLFWLSAAIFCYVRLLQTFETRFYIWLAILAAVSTATKDYAYGAFVLLPIPLSWHLAKHLYGSTSLTSLVKAMLNRRHWIGLAAFLVAFVVVENWIWNFSGFVNHVKFISGNDPVKGSLVTTQVGRFDVFTLTRLETTAFGLRLVLGWIGLPLCLVGTVVALGRRPSAVATLLWPLGSYYFFTVVQFLPENNLGSAERPFIMMGFILAILGGQFLDALWSAVPMPVLARVACAALLAVVFLNGFAIDVVLLRDTRYQAEKWVAQNVPQEAAIELYGPRAELPRAPYVRGAPVVNHCPSPTCSDRELLGEHAALQRFPERRPAFIVVSELYLQRFTQHSRIPDISDEDFHRIRDFFESLENKRLGYKEVARFDPTLSRQLGLRDNLIPAIIVYQRVIEEVARD